jgi:hypothetical protein
MKPAWPYVSIEPSWGTNRLACAGAALRNVFLAVLPIVWLVCRRINYCLLMCLSTSLSSLIHYSTFRSWTLPKRPSKEACSNRQWDSHWVRLCCPNQLLSNLLQNSTKTSSRVLCSGMVQWSYLIMKSLCRWGSDGRSSWTIGDDCWEQSAVLNSLHACPAE